MGDHVTFHVSVCSAQLGPSVDTRTCVSLRMHGDVPPFPREGGFACCTPLGARQWIHARPSVYGVYAALHEFLREGDSEVDGSCLEVFTLFFLREGEPRILCWYCGSGCSLGASSHFGATVLHQTTGCSRVQCCKHGRVSTLWWRQPRRSARFSAATVADRTTRSDAHILCMSTRMSL